MRGHVLELLLFVRFLMAVALLAAMTLQAVAVLMPARQAAGGFVDRNPCQRCPTPP